MKIVFFQSQSKRRRDERAFSLVEVTVAIGIFAFVIVAIIGLFPAALTQRNNAAVESRAVLAAQQVFESIQGSPSKEIIYLPRLAIMGQEDPKLRRKSLKEFPVTLQFGRIGTSALRAVDGQSGWVNGESEESADALARIRIEPEAGSVPGLYRATVDYGRPASLPESKRRNFSFSKLVVLP